MKIFSTNDINRLRQTSLDLALSKLKEVEVYSGDEPSFAGLNGWVFEQTIRYCATRELEAKGVNLEIKEQVSLGGRAKADLHVGNTVIELKTSGLFGQSDVERYGRYRGQALDKGFNRYLYLTWDESHKPYRSGLEQVLGKENVFYISEEGERGRFIDVIIAANS